LIDRYPIAEGDIRGHVLFFNSMALFSRRFRSCVRSTAAELGDRVTFPRLQAVSRIQGEQPHLIEVAVDNALEMAEQPEVRTARAPFLKHRYLGIAVGLLMAICENR
jgi:hypothetical protein